VRVERLCANPELLLLRDFVTEDEARALITAADERFQRSPTVCDEPGGGCVIDQRTSSSADVPSNAMTEAIQARGKLFSALPIAETLQVVRYEPGQEYKPHLDAFDSSDGGNHAKAQYEGRQREATILVYLQAPEAGGDTIFPELNLRVPPTPGTAIFWRNVKPNGEIDGRTLHGGAPVQRGVKYAANLWLRGPVRDQVLAYALTEDVQGPAEESADPVDTGSVAIMTAGAGLGAVVAGGPGALVGGAIGWTVDALRRRL
jgi:prolyl 4-hydroxylase